MYLFLPGYNPNNKRWYESLRDSFKVRDKLMLYYDHWENNKEMSWLDELEKIMVLNIQGGTTVIGKGAGCILGLKAQKEGILEVNEFVFIGFPYYWAKERESDVDFLIDNLNTKTLFIQKKKDPLIGHDELKTLLLAKSLNVETLLYERDGESDSDFNYKDVGYLKRVIENFVNN
jgi:predicted alpha/beta hydrolase family esterase